MRGTTGTRSPTSTTYGLTNPASSGTLTGSTSDRTDTTSRVTGRTGTSQDSSSATHTRGRTTRRTDYGSSTTGPGGCSAQHGGVWIGKHASGPANNLWNLSRHTR